MQMLQYLIVCPLLFLAGFIDAIGGGGGLISIPAYIISGVPVHNAIATNKLSSCMGTGLTTWQYWVNGYIRPKLALLCVAAALVGSPVGAEIALRIDADVFKLLMLVILPVTAFYVLKKKDIGKNEEELSFKKTAVISVAAALIVGMYDGFYGPGTGTFFNAAADRGGEAGYLHSCRHDKSNQSDNKYWQYDDLSSQWESDLFTRSCGRSI